MNEMISSNKDFLKEYDGPAMTIMEICGTHTAEISHSGIPGLLSPKIRQVSGPGCPVCVTVTSYIDKLVELCINPQNVIVTFGDMMHVTGQDRSLGEARDLGAQVRMVYSPFDILKMAEEDKTKTYIFSAIGFETTTPVYSMILEEAIDNGIGNIRLLTSLKTMPNVVDWVCKNHGEIDGFLAPGHVCTIAGSRLFFGLAEKYLIPFAVAGFTGPLILDALAALVKSRGEGKVINAYPSFVTLNGNEKAQQAVKKYFEPCDAAWRGFGMIEQSGMILREEYQRFDAGSRELVNDRMHNTNCRCALVLTGAQSPLQCPLFGRECTPQSQQGACMVSREGACYNYFINRRR